VDDLTLRFLIALREQVPWVSESSEGDRNKVQAGIAALEVGIKPDSPEFDRIVNDLVRYGYVTPHSNRNCFYRGSTGRASRALPEPTRREPSPAPIGVGYAGSWMRISILGNSVITPRMVIG
jgi:hypothetical protein